MKLSDLRKEATFGIEPDRKINSIQIRGKAKLITAIDFAPGIRIGKCDCGALLHLRIGFTICPLCGKDLNSFVSEKRVFDFGGISKTLYGAVERTSATIRLLGESIMKANNFHHTFANIQNDYTIDQIRHQNCRCSTNEHIVPYTTRIILPYEKKKLK